MPRCYSYSLSGGMRRVRSEYSRCVAAFFRHLSLAGTVGGLCFVMQLKLSLEILTCMWHRYAGRERAKSYVKSTKASGIDRLPAIGYWGHHFLLTPPHVQQLNDALFTRVIPEAQSTMGTMKLDDARRKERVAAIRPVLVFQGKGYHISRLHPLGEHAYPSVIAHHGSPPSQGLEMLPINARSRGHS